MTRYTDEHLAALIADESNSLASKGQRRQALALIKVPQTHRDTILDEAHLAQNMTGGRLSDHLHALAANWQRYVTAEAEETRSRLARSH